MGWPQCNSTLEDMKIREPSLFDSHDFTFHQLTLVVSAICGLVAIVVSLTLMFMHTIRYSRPKEQRHIIRILFMVPVYALVSFLSIVFYNHSVYYEVLRDCYEAFAIASFFSLMCAYIAEDLHHQKDYFRTIKPRSWIWPMGWIQKCCGGERGCLRTPRSGLTWFNVIWVAIFQYCFIRISMTITAVLAQYWERYCLESLNPAFAHIWVMVIEGVAVSITMYCLIQFYIQIRGDIAQHKPILKVLAIKLVIFLSFWQTILISFLTSSGAISATNRIQTPDIKVGIPSMLLCIEMAIFSIFHWWSFSYRPYVIGSKRYQDTYGQLKENVQPRYQGGPLGIKALIQAFNFYDLAKAIGRSARWVFVGRRNRMADSSYANSDPAAEVQKLNDLGPSSTTYTGAGGMEQAGTNVPSKASTYVGEGSGLLTASQKPPHPNPYPLRESDSSGDSPWTEVEPKEYFHDQETRKQDPRRDNFQPTQSNPYDTRYNETQTYPTRTSSSQPTATPMQQQTGVLRPAGTAPGTGIPGSFVTRQDIENTQQTHSQPPYPRNMASVNTRNHGPTNQHGNQNGGNNGGFI